MIPSPIKLVYLLVYARKAPCPNTTWYCICSSKQIYESTWTKPLGCCQVNPFLKGTKGKSICNGKGDLNLHGYCDSDMAGDVDTGKSTYGYIYTLAEGAISWCSRLQQIVALSTTESGYISATEASKEAIWLTLLCSELGLPKQIAVLHYDDQSVISLAKNPVHHTRFFNKVFIEWMYLVEQVAT